MNNSFYKKLICVLLVLFSMPLLFAARKKNEEKELIVFAAQSLKASLLKVSEIYKKENPSLNVICNFDSSGNLARMMKNGSYFDVFISADLKTMDDVEENDLISLKSRKNLLSNKLVLVSSLSVTPLDSFESVLHSLSLKEIFFAMGDKSVPAGNYMRNVFSYFDFDEESVNSNIVYGTNVAAVSRLIQEGLAQYGAVYETDAVSHKLHIIDTATDEMTKGSVLYPCVISKKSENEKSAADFLSFLSKNKEAISEFEAVGFTVL